jgi:DNA-binding response OmpR family regulator
MRGFALGADDYVVKPFNPMELLARIKRLVRKG